MVRFGWLGAWGAVAGCGGDGGDGGGTGDTGAPGTEVVNTLPTGQTVDCTTDSRWTGGDRESPLMHPGRDCVDCHTARGEGPRYALAGTVHAGLVDVDDCNGVEGVTVRITDADGVVTELTTNAAGNFFTLASIASPYTAEIESAGKVRRMAGAQTDGACNACHTPEGRESAPGRIVVP